jgi:hypothetical protein
MYMLLVLLLVVDTAPLPPPLSTDTPPVAAAAPPAFAAAPLLQSLDNLRRWFPDQDPFVVLQNNPKLLVNISEADLEADPLYGEITTAG